MSIHESAPTESIELDDRTVRALTESMTVLPEGEDIYTVVGENGNGEYRVDTRVGRCTCRDHRFRDVECKHIRRVAFAVGDRPIPGGVDGVDPLLGEHTDGERRSTTTDGGVQRRRECPERTRVPVDGGVLVYDSRGTGRELVGFENVTEWSALRSSLAARGHSVGAIHHLPELDR